jgi:hypothetical protein
MALRTFLHPPAPVSVVDNLFHQKDKTYIKLMKVSQWY